MGNILYKISTKEKKVAMQFIEKLKREEEKFISRSKEVLRNEEGIGVVEIILILVVLIALVIIFKEQLTNIVNTIFEKITSESSGI